jgi:glutathione S-transferase
MQPNIPDARVLYEFSVNKDFILPNLLEALMYKLYWEAQSGAIAPQVMLEELDIDYEKVPVDMAHDAHHSPDYLSLNPTGQVPALGLPDGSVIGETAAIILTLGERHRAYSLVPCGLNGERPSFLFWLMYMATSGYMAFGRSNHPERHTTDQGALNPVRQAAEAHIERLFDTLENAIKGSPFFQPSGYSALDIYLTMLTTWHRDKTALFERNPKIALLCSTVENRPSYNQVMRDHGLS